jgi:hypothetical protein
MPECYAYNRLAVPYEVTFRSGPSFIVGGNRFDHILQTGIANQLTAQGFCYNPDHSAAWTLTLGLTDSYHPADETVPVIRRLNDITVQVIANGQFRTADVVSDYGIEYLHRQYIELAAGREWYWFTSDPCGVRLALGLDAGGRMGSAHAQLTAVNRRLTPAPNPALPGDGVTNTSNELPENHVTDLIEGLFCGCHGGMFYSRWGYDIYLGARVEVSRDWIKIVDFDNKVDQLNVLIEIGVRF